MNSPVLKNSTEYSHHTNVDTVYVGIVYVYCPFAPITNVQTPNENPHGRIVVRSAGFRDLGQ